MLINLLNGNLSQEEYLRENSVCIIYKKMPKKIYGFIHRYRDLNVITINWNISKEKKKKAIIHELAHLELHHLDKQLFEFLIEDVEDEADNYIKFLLEHITTD